MRIAGGEFKGRIIKVPKVPNLRPSTERIREAIFSVLGGDIIDSSVADLFCGSGALGLEALSRGAKDALLVDSDHHAVLTARENVKSLRLESRARIMTANALNLRPTQIKDIKIIFADPPYHNEFCQRLVALLSLQKFDWYGILVLEHESDWNYDGDDFRIARRINFGDSAVTFLLRFRPNSSEL